MGEPAAPNSSTESCPAGELYGLELTDIDFIRNQIKLRRSVYDGQVQSPKTQNAVRVIDVKPWLIELIKQYIGDRKTGLLFMNNGGRLFGTRVFLVGIFIRC